MHESNKMSFGRYFIVYLTFWKSVCVLLWISFDHGYDLEREHFSANIRVVSVSGSKVSG